MEHEKLIEKLNALKKEKNAVVLAHYYAIPEVQDAADYIGDSFFLATLANELDAEIIVLCGVYFMGESAKILNPNKVILVPDETADCPMAHMATVLDIEKVRAKYDDVAVVCYVNSTAELKANSDVCVTSSNALNIVKKLPNKNIFFIPDKNLAHYIAKQLPEKNFIFNNGWCCVHENITEDDVKKIMRERSGVRILAHPECEEYVLKYADFIGSTSMILDFATQNDDEEFIILTEIGILHQLKRKNPGKKFYIASDVQVCNSMKKNTVAKIVAALESGSPAVELDGEFIKKSYAPMKKMVELA
jgi:quinolinate synthase